MVKKTEDIVVQTITKLLIPFIQLFAFYVLMHGHISPGGGFQGGVILGASFIMLIIAYDLDTARQRLSKKINILMSAVGVAIYCGIGLLCIFLGGNFLDYGKLPISKDIPHNRYFSILGVELGITITVMAVMLLIFIQIANYGSNSKIKDSGDLTQKESN